MSAANTVPLPESKPRAMREHLVVPSIRSREALPRREHRRHLQGNPRFDPTARDSFQSRDSAQAGRHHRQGSGERPKPALPECSRHANGLATAEAGYRKWTRGGGEFGHRGGAARSASGYRGCGRARRCIEVGCEHVVILASSGPIAVRKEGGKTIPNSLTCAVISLPTRF